jgi:hypothetical protein
MFIEPICKEYNVSLGRIYADQPGTLHQPLPFHEVRKVKQGKRKEYKTLITRYLKKQKRVYPPNTQSSI